MAARLDINGCFTVASAYFSGSHRFSYEILSSIIVQLPQPFLLLGDFNCHHRMWGSNRICTRGQIVERILTDFNLNILNIGAPTRIYGNSETAIDLSICSPVLQLTTGWNTFDTPRDSDHCPILLKMTNRSADQGVKKRDYRKVDWKKFSKSTIWTQIPNKFDERTPEELLHDFYRKLDGAIIESTQEYEHKTFFPKPWLSAEVTLLKDREKAYRYYKRRKSSQNFLTWKRLRAKHRRIVIEHKRKSWQEMAEKMICSTPMSKV